MLLLFFGMAFTAVAKDGGCPMKHIVPVRLPDLHIPRSGHNTFFANGELTVVGGHTTHFVPTPTAEYYSEGEWHPLPMAYPHDNGFAVVLRSGDVIIGGGHKEELGVGQTYTLERYTPTSHTFEGFGCLDRRRVLASGIQLADGRVIIAGNHYADDAIACFDGSSQVQHVKDVKQGRSNPYILPIAADDALILGANDQYDDPTDTVWVDRLRGDAFRVPLLEQWKLVYLDHPFSSNACAIGDDSYLLTATDENGQLGFVMVRDTCFSLLPTACPVPMQCQWGPIFYKGPIILDRECQRGFVIGVGDGPSYRQYILCVDLSTRPSPITLYYTDPLEHAAITIPVVTPDGDLILAGGILTDNYKPHSAVWCYHFDNTPLTADTLLQRWAIPAWLWLVMAVVVIAVLAYIILLWRRKKSHIPLCPNTVGVAPLPAPAPDGQTPDDITEGGTLATDKTAELMERICQLMDEEQLYLRSNLKLQDVAILLNTNSYYVSECINSGCGQSFSQFVNTFRVRHAQELLRQQPDKKTSSVASASGFSTEASFFRNFKAVTGMTPREWVATLQITP